MNQQKSSSEHDAITKQPKQLKLIRKPIKLHPFTATPRRTISFTRAKKSSSRPLPCRPAICNNSNNDISGFSLSHRWIQFCQAGPQRYISSVVQQIPTLSSINQLFSISSSETLQDNCDWMQLTRYSKLCSLFDFPHGSTVMLREGEQKGMILVESEQGSEQCVWHGMQLWGEQLGLWERRATFMEKLRSNESKYDTSLGRMSQISKELAFTYRSYLQTRTQVESSLNSIVPHSPPNHYQLLQISTRYAQLLITKNLRHTFRSHDLDRLNYFKLREYIEADRVEEFENISSFLDLQSFIQRRKPKRGRRLTLATACSVCLSDYHELCNPLRSCGGCGLRAHRLCLSFENKRCGNCSFQKLQREVKEAIGWCLICKKPGMMVVKLDQLHYAHGFCLLLHGFWRVGSSQRNSLYRQETKEARRLDETLPLIEQRCQLLNEIEFYSPFDSSTKVFIPALDSSLCKNNRPVDGHSLALPDPIQESEQSQSQLLDIINRFPKLEQNNNDNNVEFWGQQIKHEQNRKDCRRCRTSLFQNCYLVCHRCGKEYHAFCAFFAGFQISLQQNQSIGVSSLLEMSCCGSECAKVGWNRRFKLNYQRCAYGVTAEDVNDIQQSKLWLD